MAAPTRNLGGHTGGMDSERAKELKKLGARNPHGRGRDNKREVGDILAENGIEPVIQLANCIKHLDSIFAESEYNLTFKEKLDYIRLRASILERQQSFVYTRKAIEHKTERTNVTIDHEMIQKLNERALGKDNGASIHKAIDAFSTKVAEHIPQDYQDDPSVIATQ